MVHLPLACVLLLTAAALVLALIRARREAWLAWAVVAANVFLHLLLDSTAGGIRWLWPFSDAELVLAHVTARHRPWYLNFILHWTFALEIVITAAALLLWLWRRRRLT